MRRRLHRLIGAAAVLHSATGTEQARPSDLDRADRRGPRRPNPVGHARQLLGRVPTGVWVILAIALVLRLTVVAVTWDTPVTLDPQDFSRTAASIAQGHGYPPSNRAPGGGASAFRPPGYPVFLAGVYAIAGRTAPAAGRLAGAFLGTLSVTLIGLIALRLWGRRVGMLALGIAAAAPPLVILSTALISEALFVPVMLAAVLTALESRASKRRYRWLIATGVLVGVACLTRTNGLILLIPFSLAFAPTRSRRELGAWMPPAIFVVTAVLTIAPWTVRNWIVFHAFIPVSDESGYTLAGTYNRVSRADRRTPALWIEAEHGKSPEYAQILRTATARRWNEVTYGDHLQAAAIRDIESDPGYVLKVAYWNTIRTLDLGEGGIAAGNLRDTDIPLGLGLLVIITSPLLLVLALGGLLTRRARRVPRWLWLVPLCMATSVFVTGFIRFRAPIDPFLVMLIAIAADDFLDELLRLIRSVRRVRLQSAPAERPNKRITLTKTRAA
ncbi:MAG: glycosyltransferase family 39 protein [Solirubrobacteraceae bacterium]